MKLLRSVLLSCCTTAASSSQRQQVRFGYFTQPKPWTVACARGLFDTAEYEVICFPQSSGSYAASKLEDGLLDLAIMGSTPFAEASSRGLDITSIYIDSVSSGDEGLVVRRNAILAPADLAGRTVATPFASTAHFLLLYFLTIFQVLDSVTVVFMVRHVPSNAHHTELRTVGSSLPSRHHGLLRMR